MSELGPKFNRTMDNNEGVVTDQNFSIDNNHSHESISKKLSKILLDQKCYEEIRVDSVYDLSPGNIKDYNNLVKEHGILVYANEEWQKVAENTSEVSTITMRIFGELKKIDSLVNELKSLFEISGIKPVFMLGFNKEEKEMGTQCLKIEDKDVLKRKYSE